MARRSSSRRRRKRTGSTSGGKGLNTVSILAFLLFGIILVAAIIASQLNIITLMKQQQNTVMDATAKQATAGVQEAISSYRQLMLGIASDPAIENLLASGDVKAILAREQQLKAMFDGALEVRFLKAGTNTVNRSLQPHLSFACLDMVRQSETKGVAPAIEVHAHGTPQQHVDLIQPIVRGGKVISHLQVVLDVKMINKWISKASKDVYVELSQQAGNKAAKVLTSAGDASYKSGQKLVIPIQGSNLTATVWTTAAISASLFNPVTLAIVAIGILLAAIIVWMLRNSMSKSLVSDLEIFAQMAVQLARGKSVHDYSFKMSEFQDAAVRVKNMPAESMERERDYDPSTISMGQPDMSPMYVDNNSLTVEELDSDLDDIGEEPVKKPEVPMNEQAVARPVAESSMSTQAGSNRVQAVSATPPAEIFKAYDIRGIVGKTLTTDHIELIGKALGSEATSRGLKVMAFGRDGRLSGPELGKSLVKGILSAGIDVIDVGLVPTPVLYYAAAEKAEGSGVMLTGSHNPPDYNGIKMVLGGETLSGDTIQELRQRVETNNFTSGAGKYASIKLNEQYIQRITSDVKLKRKLKVVIDCGNGAAGAIAPTLFKQLGCEVMELFCDVDGNFPNHHPDPSQPENLNDLIQAVKDNKADLGLAFDGDGDRIGVISGDGAVIWPDRFMMLFAEDILSRNHGAQIIFDIKCSSNLLKAIWEKGGEPLMWKTGHSLIKAKMKQTGALLAGEMSGHIFFKERWYGFDDALYSGARLLEILAADMRQPRVVFASLPDAVNTPELKINMMEGEHHKFMEQLLAEADFGDANVSMIDGIRADYADGWGLVRASNTTPCLVLRFEGNDEEAMKKVQARFRKALLGIKPDLKLPF